MLSKAKQCTLMQNRCLKTGAAQSALLMTLPLLFEIILAEISLDNLPRLYITFVFVASGIDIEWN